MAKQKIIEIPIKIIVGIFLFLFILFIISILIENKRINSYRTIIREDSLHNYIERRPDRGGILLNDSLSINSSIPFIHIPFGFNSWDALKPVISFTNKEYQYKLGDIEIPYLLIKKKYNDTLYAIKDNDTLLLLLSTAKY